MSLFVCSKCGCIDNTATSYYWALIRPCKNRIYDKSLKGYEGKPLCSECAAIEYSKGGEDRKKKVVSTFFTILIMVVCKAVIL